MSRDSGSAVGAREAAVSVHSDDSDLPGSDKELEDHGPEEDRDNDGQLDLAEDDAKDTMRQFAKFVQYVYESFPESVGEARVKPISGTGCPYQGKLKNFKPETFTFKEFLPAEITRVVKSEIDKLRRNRVSDGKSASLTFSKSKRRKYYQISGQVNQMKSDKVNSRFCKFLAKAKQSQNPAVQVSMECIRLLEEHLNLQEGRSNFALWIVGAIMRLWDMGNHPDLADLRAQGFESLQKALKDLLVENAIAASNVRSWRRDALLKHLPNSFRDADKEALLLSAGDSPGYLFSEEALKEVQTDVDSRLNREANLRRETGAKAQAKAFFSPLSQSPYNQPSSSGCRVSYKKKAKRAGQRARRRDGRSSSSSKPKPNEGFRQ